MDRTHLSWADCMDLAKDVVRRLEGEEFFIPDRQFVSIYGVPRGGIHAAQLVSLALFQLGVTTRLVETPEEADLVVDDIVDSGATRQRLVELYGLPFASLVDKPANRISNWVTFPWERAEGESGPQDNVRRILQYLGEDPDREGLRNTPDRVVRSWDTLFGGYKQDPKKVMTIFEDGACDEMVLLKDIEVASMCEHHMLPFTGKAHIAYIPDRKIIGVSKLARILEIYSRRLQVQERLTTQVTTALMDHLQPKGAACVIEARHLCMSCRGVQKQHSVMVTSSLTGVFREPAVRQEFLAFIGR